MKKNRRVYFLALVSGMLLYACGSASNDSSPPPDPRPEIIALLPDANETSAFLTDPILAVFDEMMSPADASTFLVHGAFTGRRLMGTYSGGGTETLTFDPDADFRVGEEIEVTLTEGLASTAGRPAVPFVYRFRAEVLSGSGSFAGVASVVGQTDARGVAAGDWDADGDLDLAVANFGANSLAILFNDGAGAFSNTQTITGLQGATAISAGDWDADGDLDLAVANFGANSLAILFNDTSGSFSNTRTIASLRGATAISAGDWDADGDLDLAVANFGANSVVALRNNGAGFFSTVQTITGQFGARGLAAGDWNSDGSLDLVSASSGDNSVKLLRNQP